LKIFQKLQKTLNSCLDHLRELETENGRLNLEKSQLQAQDSRQKDLDLSLTRKLDQLMQQLQEKQNDQRQLDNQIFDLKQQLVKMDQAKRLAEEKADDFR